MENLICTRLPRDFRGYALNFAATLDAACPGFLLRILHASDLSRQTFFAVAAEAGLDGLDSFLGRLGTHSPAKMSELRHLDPVAQVARALILLKPRAIIEALFGFCPDGLLGALGRFGGGPLYGPDTYNEAHELFADPAHKSRAKVLRQIEGTLTPDHITIVRELDEVLLHPKVVRFALPREVAALNSFVRLLPSLCDATPELIRESLDRLHEDAFRGAMSRWAQAWMTRQVRPPISPPIPADDPDLKLRLGHELISLGRRFRNCAAQRQSFSLLVVGWIIYIDSSEWRIFRLMGLQ